GAAVDLEGLGDVCRQAGVLLAVNGSQGVGCLPINVATLAIDALTCTGAKWLCGPYGTGFSWFSAGLLADLEETRGYWLAGTEPSLGLDLGNRKAAIKSVDATGTPSFFNLAAFAASLETVYTLGTDPTAGHDLDLNEPNRAAVHL